MASYRDSTIRADGSSGGTSESNPQGYRDSCMGQVTEPQGGPVVAARVHLISKGYMDERVLTDCQGRFTLKAIPPTQPRFGYKLTINAAGYGPARYRRFEAEGQGGETLDIGRFPLNPATESVSDWVVDAKGVPVPGASVYVNSVGGVCRSTTTVLRQTSRAGSICRIFAKGP